jgi:O-antigen/teichoic acid export membrane protein
MQTKHLELRRLARDSTYNLIRQGWAIFIGLIVSILLARGLGKQDWGILTITLLLPEILITLLNLGIGPATIYYVSRGQWSPQRALGGNLALALWTSLTSIIIGMGLIFLGGDFIFPQIPKSLLAISLIYIPISFLVAYLNTIYHGLQDFRTFNLIGMISQLLLLILVVLLVWIFPGGVYGALYAYIGSNLGGLIVLIALLTKKMNLVFKPNLHLDTSHLNQAFQYGIKAHLANFITYLNYRLDNLLLNHFAGTSQVGIYSVAVGIGEKLWIPSSAISAVILPRIASQDYDEERRRQLTPMTARYVTWLSLLMVIVLWPVAGWLITLLYSPEFQEAAFSLRLILPGIVLLNTVRVLANDIAGRGLPEINLFQSAIALGVNIIANLILIPLFSARGAALASTISYSVLAILTLRVYCRLAKVSWLSIYLPNRTDLAYLLKVWGIALKRLRSLVKLGDV